MKADSLSSLSLRGIQIIIKLCLHILMQHLILTEQMIGQEYAAKKVEGLDEQYVKSCAINVYLTENG